MDHSVPLCVCESLPLQAQNAISEYVFEGARLITGDGSAPIENSAFIVANGRFLHIGERGKLKFAAGIKRIDLTGKTVIPALIDAHVHIGYANYLNWTDGKQNYTRSNLLEHLRRAAYFGVGVIFSPGTDIAPLCYEVRDDILAGKYSDVATWVTSGPGLTSPDSVRDDTQRQNAYPIATPEEARRAVQELAARHVPVIKAWVNSGGQNQFAKQPMNRATYGAMIDEAQKHDVRVLVHDRIGEVAETLIETGNIGFAHEIDDIGASPEYLASMKRPAGPDARLLSLMRARGAKLYMTLTQPSFPGGEAERLGHTDPLLADSLPPRVLALMRQGAIETPQPGEMRRAEEYWQFRRSITRDFIATGIRIGMGSDADHLSANLGNVDKWGRIAGLDMIGWAAHAEMEEMVESGMPPAEVIVAATKTNAEWLGLRDMGIIAPGKIASFVVLDANPLDEIQNTRRIRDVYLGGKRVDRGRIKKVWSEAWEQHQ